MRHLPWEHAVVRDGQFSGSSSQLHERILYRIPRPSEEHAVGKTKARMREYVSFFFFLRGESKYSDDQRLLHCERIEGSVDRSSRTPSEVVCTTRNRVTKIKGEWWAGAISSHACVHACAGFERYFNNKPCGKSETRSRSNRAKDKSILLSTLARSKRAFCKRLLSSAEPRSIYIYHFRWRKREGEG